MNPTLTSAPVAPDLDGESGQVMVEAAIVMPAMIFLVLTVMQLTMVQHARIMTDYAAFCAARAGIVFNADKKAMTEAATIALLPTMARTDTFQAAVLNGAGAIITENGLRLGLVPIVRVTTFSPRRTDFSTANTRHLNGREIDFDDTRLGPAKANLLEIEVKYFYRMRIPFANSMLQAIFFASRPGAYTLDQWKGVDMSRPEMFGQNAKLIAAGTYAGSGEADAAGIVASTAIGNYYFPLKATYTMRMQSNPYLGNTDN